ncbi:Clp protease N-terminal domain-containing protein [Plantactinospora sp. KBS50]|uniref:Clp protease N-terminal domain-containing protein n=1 Tax=Plantactinospora sp. KBS50 TaxID=2024580 RepID=UPI000BAB039D|nr:Clp protease N-terminal domain-containing protein [Plantactinospora sp. KBS50]ASW55557.1 peptidase [Plantactinospora sp. KBS50]
MPKINVYLPDELAEAVKESGIPVSAICQRALEQAVRRVSAIRETVLAGRLDDLTDADLATRLPHFTDRAREVLRLGTAEARATGSDTIGTGHVLGGLLAEGGNLALRVLRAVEIDPGRLGHELARRPSTEAARTDQAAGTEQAAPTEQAAGTEQAAPTAQSSGTAAAPAEGGATPRFSAPAADALELAVSEAAALGHNYVGCEHLLLGLVAEPDGVGGHVLRAQGAELRLTRRAVAAALAGYVHLQARARAPQPEGDDMAALAAAVRQELQPLVSRIERLEVRIGVTEG